MMSASGHVLRRCAAREAAGVEGLPAALLGSDMGGAGRAADTRRLENAHLHRDVPISEFRANAY